MVSGDWTEQHSSNTTDSFQQVPRVRFHCDEKISPGHDCIKTLLNDVRHAGYTNTKARLRKIFTLSLKQLSYWKLVSEPPIKKNKDLDANPNRYNSTLLDWEGHGT